GGFEDEGEPRPARRGVLEEFADVLGGLGGAAGVQALAAEGGDDGGQGGVGGGGAGGGDEEGGGKGAAVGDLLVGGHEALVLEHEREDDVTHAEADRGRGGAAEEFDEVVVAAAAGDGPLGAGGLVDLEDHAGVVRQAADDGEFQVAPVQ